MLTRDDILEWHNPPSSEHAQRLLRLAHEFFNTRPGNNKNGSGSDTRRRLVRNTPIRGPVNPRRTGKPSKQSWNAPARWYV